MDLESIEIAIDCTVSQDGKLLLDDQKKQQLKTELKAFSGKDVVLYIKKKKRKRTNKQNNYYWLLITIVHEHLKEAGYEALTVNDVHEYFKSTYLLKSVLNEDTGEVLTFVRSTASLSTKEFTEYIQNIHRHSAEHFDLVLPDPETSNVEISHTYTFEPDNVSTTLYDMPSHCTD